MFQGSVGTVEVKGDSVQGCVRREGYLTLLKRQQGWLPMRQATAAAASSPYTERPERDTSPLPHPKPASDSGGPGQELPMGMASWL